MQRRMYIDRAHRALYIFHQRFRDSALPYTAVAVIFIISILVWLGQFQWEGFNWLGFLHWFCHVGFLGWVDCVGSSWLSLLLDKVCWVVSTGLGFPGRCIGLSYALVFWIRLYLLVFWVASVRKGLLGNVCWVKSGQVFTGQVRTCQVKTVKSG